MAIWNYRAELIPRDWIIEEYGDIPKILPNEETIDQVENVDDLMADELSHWLGIDYPCDFIERASELLPVLESQPEFKSFGVQGSDRIEIWTVDGKPDFIGIQLDQRNPNVELTERFAEYACYLGTLIVPDDRFTCVEPTFEDLIFDIAKSRSAAFCRDPEGTLRSIHENTFEKRSNSA